MAVNKVIYGGNTLIDLTGDTVTAADVASGVIFHLPNGESEEGTNTKDSDTQDATAVVGEILATKTAYARGAKLTGTMPNNGAVSGVISTVAGTYTVPQGYHDGSGTVGINPTEQAKLIATNIRKDVVVLGVTGTLEPDIPVTAQAKTVTPATSSQTVTPDSGYDYLSQVIVAAIPYTETANSAGGYTATIG